MSITAAASALRRLPLFERVSLRLLQDLVEYASLERWWDDDGRCGAGGPATVSRLGLLRQSLRGGTLAERQFDGGWLERALASSFSLAHAFVGSRRELFDTLVGPGHPSAAGDAPPTHWLLLAKDPRFAQRGPAPFDVDVVQAAGLLARALDRTTPRRERAVVAVLEQSGLTFHCWDGERPRDPIPMAAPSGSADPPLDPRVLHDRVHEHVVRALGAPPDALFHVICVHRGGEPLPAWWRQRFRTQGFHRLVYLTAPGRSLRPPDALMDVLFRGAWDPDRGDGPYFSSVVPTVVLPPALETRSYNPLRAPWTADLKTLEVVPGDESDAGNGGLRAERLTLDARLRRDLCRVRLDPANLDRCEHDPVVARSLDRWARAVTNRQVGLALSGGGATSAALVPFIEELGRNGVPIDVVAGFSGGAILGAYVATDRLPSYYGLRHRLCLQLLLPVATVFSEAIEMAVNLEFGAARLDDLDVRFVPMTVEMRTDGTPRACAVVGGTLGEGIRVSGLALGVFSPAERRGTRYVDAGVAMGVPAAVLPTFGADLAIACNSIVPPSGRLPTTLLPEAVGECLRRVPVAAALFDRCFDRLGDFWVGFLTMLRETARSGARDADVFYEVSPDETPFLDAFMWLALDRIRRTAAEGRRWEDELDACVERWALLRGGE